MSAEAQTAKTANMLAITSWEELMIHSNPLQCGAIAEKGAVSIPSRLGLAQK